MAFCLRTHSGLFIRRILSQKCGKPIDTHRIQHLRLLSTSLQLSKVVSFNLSDIGEGIREVSVKEWFIKVGDTVEQFDNLCEVQSDKASVTITSRYDGKIVKIYHKIDDIALVGQPLVDIDVQDDDEAPKEEGKDPEKHSDSSSDEDEPKKPTDNAEEERKKVLTTPAVRRLAMENKLDLTKVTPTGKYGRILKGDVLEHLNLIPAGTVKPHPTLLQQKPQGIPIAPPKVLAEDRVEQLKGVRKAMLKSMTEALKIPHFAYSDEINMSKLMSVREELKADALEKGVKLTYMPFFIKAASRALTQYPILNSSLDEPNESVIYKAAHNISVAMDTPQGLVVPNVKNCEQKSIIDIAKALNELQEKGQKGSLGPDDFADGTFSLSNIGIIGGTYTHPCIMSPQVAIGAMGRTKLVPRFGADGEIIKAFVMSVSWSADHRVIDGVTMARFSNLWKKYLENPNLFLLD
ncbi:lipoamide acyltransferase component of branched-chain alpha-keto acid dehydrogenase complex, mitochondrial [Phlebotomus argentipes]|uniref:lipoamide acyltransferase component of branched-chain alpha-keto acid dehydrogenase complex, mitochondrial n=1 Tax=Phlebotomus argentipes TaxID=94469 RepID=UPI002892C15F|nr:lipoamide acyltransferase component of branched-chain alpha-keto acid dehydrogenase complex, mitochondrial [Phlebotomus argentipes]